MGEIEKAYIQDIDNIYVKYCFVYGKDWDVTSVSSYLASWIFDDKRYDNSTLTILFNLNK